MADFFPSPGIDPPSPTLSARLRELADFLAAPAAGRLTEEQRALSLGIARRLVEDAARELSADIDVSALWRDWLESGLPTAPRLAAACFARAEEHRWREHSARRIAAPVVVPVDGDEPPAPETIDTTPEADRAYLALRIADRRRADGRGSPRIALEDVEPELLRALLLDIAAWRMVQAGKDGQLAAGLGEAVRKVVEYRAAIPGIDVAARQYLAALGEGAAIEGAAASAIDRHDWLALVALAAAASRRSFADMALALTSAEAAALPALLAPLSLDRASLAPLEASLAALPSRTVETRG
ncbi:MULTISPECIES: hypothetical protein [unclassified Sphingopyxis]|uniref:hypothetical protein n=1 Tax=unclassified Sphingopyxis TaxID=2614943 RepID=UPI0007315864|nr:MULTISPECIES: hypothetical protein [unclassified Sphingopyxis]KTE24347.1 hypothetical protein ATE61_13095 [Sphingopyxis sp. H057]KTE50874.1 hypothetical protein ATE69_16790 [Sphingopyxis sp. H071]KTE52018.1 hypothetical protein ATE64_11400 [Sphingopyxis sp. H073]KTE59703.1 hypothetical protein ATE66_10525 [Sphingopyxis sp. H107]KTE62218.1 hypothetical protein ATE65_16785 [Sphingopyxis sp. H100]